ncbi:hypothetical protein GEMRC1_002112 [Eukaryota sp. GEM-RC1]
MSVEVQRRLQSELMTMMSSDDDGISAFPSGDTILEWNGTILGADGTVFDGCEYSLTFKFSEEYPYKPPVVKFSSPIFHPNVDVHGNICLDILKEEWSAAYDVRSILLSIQSLLDSPNVDSPLNNEAAQLWGDQETYRTRVLSGRV